MVITADSGSRVSDEHGIAKKDALFALLIAVLAFTVYANSLRNGFVWDDNVVILSNPSLRGEIFPLFAGIDTTRPTEPTQYYRPVTLLSFLLEYRLHGLTPVYVRIWNVLLHVLNAVLVYGLARTLLSNRYAALLAALLFAVHPVHTEAVDFNSGGRNTMLACAFALAAYLLHLRSVVKKSVVCAAIGALFFFTGLLSKEIAVCILPFLVTTEILHRNNQDRHGIGHIAFRLAFYAVSLGTYFILRQNALSAAGVTMEILPGLLSRLQDDFYIIPRYLLTIVWPFPLTSKYFMPEDFHATALPLLIGWFSIILLGGWLVTRGRSRATLFGMAWSIAFWLPVSGIIAFASDPMADRFLYVPAIGIWIIVADQLSRLLPDNPSLRRLAGGLAAGVLLALAFATVLRNADWKDDITYFSQFVREYPDRAFGYHNLGCAYLDKTGDLDAADRAFQAALAIDPGFPRLQTQLGYVRLLRKDYAGALQYYNEAIRLNVLDAEALLNRGVAYEQLGRNKEAVTDFRRFLELPVNDLSGQRSFAEQRIRALTR